MIRLLYVSIGMNSLDEKDVDRIVQHAQQQNTLHIITGALAYNGRDFAQVLEGDEQKINQLMENIKLDSRHANVIEMMRKPISSRAYADWSMKMLETRDFDELISVMTI